MAALRTRANPNPCPALQELPIIRLTQSFRKLRVWIRHYARPNQYQSLPLWGEPHCAPLCSTPEASRDQVMFEELRNAHCHLSSSLQEISQSRHAEELRFRLLAKVSDTTAGAISTLGSSFLRDLSGTWRIAGPHGDRPLSGHLLCTGEVLRRGPTCTLPERDEGFAVVQEVVGTPTLPRLIQFSVLLLYHSEL